MNRNLSRAAHGNLALRAGAAVTLAVGAIAAGPAAQAASSQQPAHQVPLPAHITVAKTATVTRTSAEVPLAQLAKHLTHSWTVTVEPGATVHSDGVTLTAAKTAHPGYVAGTTCTIDIYGPYVDGPNYPSDVVVGASVECTYAVSMLSVSAYVFSYNPTTGSYSLLNDADYVNDNKPSIAVVSTSYPIDANGYYFGATNGYVGDPIDQPFSAVQNEATYVFPA